MKKTIIMILAISSVWASAHAQSVRCRAFDLTGKQIMDKRPRLSEDGKFYQASFVRTDKPAPYLVRVAVDAGGLNHAQLFNGFTGVGFNASATALGRKVSLNEFNAGNLVLTVVCEIE